MPDPRTPTRQFRLRRGLDLPLAGAPAPGIVDAMPVRQVALIGTDFPGIKPSLLVAEGDTVRLGQTMFVDRANPQVQFTAPAAGRVRAIVRGRRRVLQAVVIDVGEGGEETFQTWSSAELAGLDRQAATAQLLQSGLWTALRTRPFGKVADPERTPSALFVNAMDTNPLSGNPCEAIAAHSEAFTHGLTVLQRLLDGPVWLCHAPGATLPAVPDRVQTASFAGPHPAGLVGTHVHHLHPVNLKRHVWTIDAVDVPAIGRLFTEGRLDVERVVAVGGPQVREPAVLRTRQGANLDELLSGRLVDDDNRVVSGSVLSGRHAWGPLAFLGRYDQQVVVLREGRDQEFLGWLRPGVERHSVTNLFASRFLPRRGLRLNTNLNGSERAMVPVGSYEKVMPHDLLPTLLLRAILVGDTDGAQQLGVLELVEEDLGLCTYVCPGKYEYGPVLRDLLTKIEHEG